ncbi:MULTISPECIES: hypothetical protein [Crateriforma]|uniref:Type II secretion system protein n=1 Tax=Crateriforma conspicua TaxID=2527996 RepID=A0A5C6FN87_9PLAN|nr:MULTISPECIES: hypothetical protein [Crateriforma]TWU62889.1 hypothetical protein V7x_46260 [Crateriforma conspicua]
MTFATSKPRRLLQGFTLIEVVVGITLFSTIIVSVLLAISRFRVAATEVRDRKEAIKIADQLMSQWVDLPTGLPGVVAGPIMGHDTMRYQTRQLDRRPICGVWCDVMRLEIVQFRTNGTYKPLTSIEYVRRDNRRTAPRTYQP